MRKITKKVELFNVEDVLSAQNQTGNYDEEINVKRINIPMRSDYEDYDEEINVKKINIPKRNDYDGRTGNCNMFVFNKKEVKLKKLRIPKRNDYNGWRVPKKVIRW